MARSAGRQPDAHGRHAREIAALDDRVGEVRGADHDICNAWREAGSIRGWSVRDGAWLRYELFERGGDARGDVGRGGRLHRVHDAGAVEQHGIGIRPADVDSYDQASERLRGAPALDGRASLASHAKTEVKSRS